MTKNEIPFFYYYDIPEDSEVPTFFKDFIKNVWGINEEEYIKTLWEEVEEDLRLFDIDKVQQTLLDFQDTIKRVLGKNFTWEEELTLRIAMDDLAKIGLRGEITVGGWRYSTLIEDCIKRQKKRDLKNNPKVWINIEDLNFILRWARKETIDGKILKKDLEDLLNNLVGEKILTDWAYKDIYCGKPVMKKVTEYDPEARCYYKTERPVPFRICQGNSYQKEKKKFRVCLGTKYVSSSKYRDRIFTKSEYNGDWIDR